jgi:hypothetical protein
MSHVSEYNDLLGVALGLWRTRHPPGYFANALANSLER